MALSLEESVPMIGRKLGHNRIVEKIGEGGMGAVYRGEDEHLSRDVAIKILPPGSLADESDRRRFRREALALSRLSHPNIEVVYDFDTESGVDFLVMEYLQGTTLKRKLSEGGLPEGDILRLGIQIAEGLSAAHAKGIVHCDLKPSNIMVEAEGHIKILDFGLAKLTLPEAACDWTTSSTPGTRIAGTLPYMAPEQLKGGKVDPRTDLYGFGNILYEMATGKLPFQESLPTALANAILHQPPPPPGRLRPALSSRLEEIILKCLEKDPESRYQSAKELLVDLRRSSSPQIAPERIAAPRRKGRRLWLSALLVIVALVAAYGGIRLWIDAVRPWMVPPYASQEIVATAACEQQPAVSPDGNYIAFVTDTSGSQDIYVTDLREGRMRAIADGPSADYEPAWLQGNAIAFTSDRNGKPAIFRVNLLGGNPTPMILDASHPAISRDGTMIAFTRESPEGNLQLLVARITDVSRVQTLFTEPDKTVRQFNPAWSPDGGRICFGRRSDLWVVNLGGGGPVRLTTDNERDNEPAWSADGHRIYFCSYREGSYAIWYVASEGGAPERLTSGMLGECHPTLSADANLLAYGTDLLERRITLREITTGRTTELSGEDSSLFAIAPDKSKLVFVKNRGGSDVNLWIQELAGGRPSGLPWRLTEGPAFTAVPAFSPDGRYVAYSAKNPEATHVWIVPSAGGSPTQLTDGLKSNSHPAWSPEGNRIALISERSGSAQIWIAPVQDGKRAGPDRMIPTGEVEAFLPTWSPRGDRIAFLGRKVNRYDVWTVGLEGASPPVQVTDKGKVKHLQWAASGELFVSADWRGAKPELYLVSPLTRAVNPFQPYLDFGKPDGSGFFEVSPDGSLVVFSRESQKGDIWLLKTKSHSF